MVEKFGRNAPCWCGSGKKYKKCHGPVEDRIALFAQKGVEVPWRALIKTEAQIDGIRASGVLNNTLLDEVGAHIHPGVSTEEIDRFIHDRTLEMGAIPAPLGFEGFPKSVCVSINDEVCHGIPCEERKLCAGDIVNVDVSTIYKGYYSDASRMFCVGQVSPERERLVETVRQSIEVGLSQVKPWNALGDMGAAIHEFIVGKGYTVVVEIGGHGVGLEFHEPPHVSYVTKRGTEMLMVPGMVFTIEPMVNAGGPQVKTDRENGWTVTTVDGQDSAQWEVTVAVTEDGYEILAH